MAAGAPLNEAELRARARALAGLTLGEIADLHGFALPPDFAHHKGIVGELLECVLGATAGSRPVPDFEQFGIELKTVPIGAHARPLESTHVCTVNLDKLAGQRWETSTVRHKLARVLWLPIESSRGLALAARRVGTALLWSPAPEEEAILRADWEEHMELIGTGRLDELDARMGVWLQIRPKGPNRDALVNSSDDDGAPAMTLPRGFYLRVAGTARILERAQPA